MKRKVICHIIGHDWIEFEIKDHNTIYDNFIEAERCRRCNKFKLIEVTEKSRKI